ncbi:DUF4263 domain-containing protein [Leptospira yasudae]|uniref:Shedu immune nuclease family protein n=1 Tax=Leptospira yasudae TaxID=2202201 RepID=UPI0010838EF5|nr:Shedu immune nuclease family protein [Leptospira yasudae]TGK27867.1 DUF4263 domain-containing protein [Leptospira yasudae]TGM06992.1 DUF4263 domain-containing protein [Leptospira yasudae]
MKEFLKHDLSIKECVRELHAFENLLNTKGSLKERTDILPFFRKHLNVAAFIGTYINDISNPDLIANEYDIFGDFVCDLAIGDSNSKTFLLVEFEDAKPESLFVRNGQKLTPEWAPRLEHGFSQVLDWFWKINDMEKTDDFESRFGTKQANIHGLVIVGREQALQQREKTRLKWRQDYTVINSKKVSVITFDQMIRDLKYRLLMYPDAANINV